MYLIRNLLRIYSYFFEAALSVLAFAISIVIFASPHQDVRLGWLPWSNRTIGFWLFGSGLTGIALVILACARKVRFLLTFFALATAVLLTRGFFFSSWRFGDSAELRRALWLTFGAFAAFVGTLREAREPTKSTYRASGRS